MDIYNEQIWITSGPFLQSWVSPRKGKVWKEVDHAYVECVVCWDVTVWHSKPVTRYVVIGRIRYVSVTVSHLLSSSGLSCQYWPQTIDRSHQSHQCNLPHCRWWFFKTTSSFILSNPPYLISSLRRIAQITRLATLIRPVVRVYHVHRPGLPSRHCGLSFWIIPTIFPFPWS